MSTYQRKLQESDPSLCGVFSGSEVSIFTQEKKYNEKFISSEIIFSLKIAYISWKILDTLLLDKL